MSDAVLCLLLLGSIGSFVAGLALGLRAPLPRSSPDDGPPRRMEVHQAECGELVAWMQAFHEPFAGHARSLKFHVDMAVSLVPGPADRVGSALWHADKADEILATAEERLAWEAARN